MNQHSLFDSGNRADHPFVEGTVARVTWYGEESGRIIVKVDVGGRIETWVGTSPPLTDGATVRARGPMVKHPQYGPQRDCGPIQPMMPVTLEGLTAWLCGGALKGVGPVTGKAIVATFGLRTREVFDSDPDALLKVPGIGKAKLAAIVAEWANAAAEFDLMAFFADKGVTATIAHRIVKQYGPRAIHVVSTQPYRLALEVSGIGFKIADDIARAIGIAEDSPERAQAGLLQALYDATTRGDCYLGEDRLYSLAAELLGADHAPLGDAIESLATTPRPAGKNRQPSPLVVLEETHSGERAVYPRALHEAETALAGRICELLAAGEQPLRGAAQAIAEFEAAARVKLAPEQREAVEAAARHRVVVVTGGPGVGKSFVTKAILAVMKKARATTLLASPTGRAAKRLNEATGATASTIHRMLGVRSGPGGRFGGFLHDREHPLQADALLLDETSMVDCQLGNNVLQALPTHARLVLVGDSDQLPSVGPGAVLRDVIASGVVPTVRLTHIFRQANGSQIIEAAREVNAGRVPQGAPLAAATRGAEFILEPESDPQIAAAKTVSIVANLRDSHGFDPIRDVQVLTPMNRGTCGTIELNGTLQAALNPLGTDRNALGAGVVRGSTVFRVGDPVMQLKNDYDRDVYNGDRGIVVRVSPEDSTLTVDIDGRYVAYEKAHLDHLTLAYACTVHKAQGSSIRCVVIVLQQEHYRLLSRPIVYTAITRAQSLCVVVADPRSFRTAVRETRREMRRTRLADRLRGDV